MFIKDGKRIGDKITVRFNRWVMHPKLNKHARQQFQFSSREPVVHDFKRLPREQGLVGGKPPPVGIKMRQLICVGF